MSTTARRGQRANASVDGQHVRVATQLSPLRPAFVKQVKTNAFSSFMLGGQ